MSERERDIKVTDRRMFTEDGELREEYSFLEDASPEPGDPEPSAEFGEPDPIQGSPTPVLDNSTERSDQREATSAPYQNSGDHDSVVDSATEIAAGSADGQIPAQGSDGPAVEGFEGDPDSLGFMDLVAMLAEPIALFLGDAQLPNGESAEDLERAGLHIDLLQILHNKTEGNLERQEEAVLSELMYRLRMRYVQKKG